ncbi:MAG: alpha/beta fold hydrolase [Leptospirales bacterium]|nr:alpha/beta fold hydrolase [Leptospirales bacterium]
MRLLARAALSYRNFQIHRKILSDGLESKTEAFEGLDFHYYCIESGKPPLILLHGFLDSAKTFRRLFPDLLNHFDLYAIDLPGFGNTTMPDQRELWRIDGIARATGRFLLHLLAQRTPELSGKAQLLTHSLGGLVAMHFSKYFEAQRIVNPFERIHCIAPGSLRFPQAERDAHRRRFYPKSVEEIRLLLAELFHETRTDLPDFLLKGLLETWSRKGYEYLALNTIEEEDFVFFPRDKRLKLAPRTYLYWGQQDKIVTLAYGKTLQSTLRCPLVTIPDSGHCPQMENAPALVASFLANALPGPARKRSPKD